MKSHLETIADINDFIETMKKDRDFAGTNIKLSKHPGYSYIIAKSYSKPMPMAVIRVALDDFDPVQRVMLRKAVYKATYGKEMPDDEAQDEMICKSEPQ